MPEKTKLIFSQPGCEYYPSARHKRPLTYGDPFDTETPERFLGRDLAMKPADFCARHIARAREFVEGGRPDKARIELERVLAVDPKNKDATALQQQLAGDKE